MEYPNFLDKTYSTLGWVQYNIMNVGMAQASKCEHCGVEQPRCRPHLGLRLVVYVDQVRTVVRLLYMQGGAKAKN